MDFLEDTNWYLDYPVVGDVVIDDIAVAVAADPAPEEGGVGWSPGGFGPPLDVSLEIEGSLMDASTSKTAGSKKRSSSETCSLPQSKACREKLRRDRLNDRFLELGSILEPGKPTKLDKATILGDAARMVTQLRTEAQQLKDFNETLLGKIKELKAEKNELRDEKQRLKNEKENLEQQVKILNATPNFFTPPTMMSTAFLPQGLAVCQKMMMPVISYPGFPMWQFMPRADFDTSKDTESCPPVA